MKGKLLWIAIVFSFFSHCAPAQTNYALLFDGVDDYVSAPKIAAYNLPKITIEMWINWINNTHTDNVSFIMSRDLNELEIHTVGAGNQQLRFIPTANLYLDTEAGLIQANQWYHIAFVYDPSASLAKCYINGVEKTLTKSGSSALNAAITQSAYPFRFGRRRDNWYPYHGKIDEVRIWNVVRSQTEIADNMSKELNGDEPGLVAYFKMNEGSGTSAGDLSSNNNTATLTNGPTWVVSEMTLPVELVSFTANLKNSAVTLNWHTATEVNNHGFDVERKYADENASWEKIGFVNGHRTSYTANSYSFQDKLSKTGRYLYRLKQIDTDGSFKYSSEQEVFMQPADFALCQNYPNPFNPDTKINYTLPADCRVKIRIYNTTGELVATLADHVETAGLKEVVWNARNFPSGLYIATFDAVSVDGGKHFSSSKKLMLMK
ncbi:MAG: LamG-like jellyroll fold domain-containing protein [Bacteroidota bacterium]